MPKHQIRHVVEAIYSSPWAIRAEKLDEILALIEKRLDGHRPAEDLAGFPQPPDDDEEDLPYTLTAGGVAIVSLNGVLSQRMGMLSRFSGGTSTESFAAAVRRADGDPAVKAVLLDVNSPGGAYGGTPEAAAAAASLDKPCWAIADTQMDSAAYWIGSAADKVFASPSSTLGSVGVYLVHQEFSKADQMMGRKRTLIKAGRFKAVGNDVDPLDAEQRSKLQARVDGIYELFVESVARQRGVSTEKVLKQFGQGESLLAKDAVAAGLADEIAMLPDVLARLEASVAQSPDMPAPPPSMPAGAGMVAQSPSKLPNTSGNGAGVSRLPSILTGVSKMDPKVRAALIARGLLQADATEETAATVLSTFYTLRGQQPAENAQQTVNDVLAGAVTTPAAKTEAEAPTVDQLTEKVVDRLTAQENFRVETIRAECALVGLDEAQTASLVGLRLSAADTRPKIRELLASRDTIVPRIVPGSAQLDKFCAVAQEALDARCMLASGGGWEKDAKEVSSAARPFLGMRLMDLAEQTLVQEGVDVRGRSRAQIALLALQSGGAISLGGEPAAYYGTGSFSNLVLNAAHKVLTRGFVEAPVTWRMWARQGESVPDFKLQNLIKFGEASDLEVTPEGQETPTDTGLADSREFFQVETYSKKISLTRQMLINDDLGAISRLPRMQGVAAARTFNKLVYGILTANPTMADTGALFNSTATSTAGGHANLTGTGSTTAAPPSVSTLQTMQALLRVQHGLNSQSTLNLAVRWLIVPAALEATALTLLRSQSDPALYNAGVKNIFYGLVDPVVEPLLDANSAKIWYVAADNAMVDTIAVHFLQGEETPVVESWWDPDRDSRIMKIRQTGAALAVDYRGLAEHTGYSA